MTTLGLIMIGVATVMVAFDYDLRALVVGALGVIALTMGA
jgi:hypothetical protein